MPDTTQVVRAKCPDCEAVLSISLDISVVKTIADYLDIYVTPNFRVDHVCGTPEPKTKSFKGNPKKAKE